MKRVALLALAAASFAAHAQSVEVRGFLEARATTSPDERAWRDGGLGKTRFGHGDDAIGGNAALGVSWQATESLLFSAAGQYVPDIRPDFDLIDASVRWRPVSTTPWRFSATGGMFFPPISLENDGVGWTSPWTITPSATDSWVGEELRVFGTELRLEHRSEGATWDVRGAVFGKNDPAGELLASRGWAMGDLTSGLDASVRQPDVHAPYAGASAPLRFKPFVEIDDRLGAYVSVGRESGDDRLRVLYYDNRADPSMDVVYANRELYGWRTRFWSAGWRQGFGDWTIAAQAMTGKTRISPDHDFLLDTDFNAGYVLATRAWGQWQPALRIDFFQAYQTFDGAPALLSEHGNGITAALNWRPNDRFRIIGEVLRIDSTRNQRALEGSAPRQVDVQAQLAVRVYF
ncbi:hypothetical protein LF41_847 [Lysobacter dokdonensis DS-58]|uniref:Porin n=1 Tax=Lysobacter dokdonensis DS-58 TaxID=1300345 RepID=A0A0A2WJF8_9GAMM|nr:porin [Lysobacter dokdonensis]KGQ20311.1 hypothetical protein LF41_847 [Lysobacter dokdonensis DS-58]